MEIRRRVGQQIKALREAKGWSQEQLADEAALHRTYVSGVERGIRNPTLTVLERFSKALDVSFGKLIDG